MQLHKLFHPNALRKQVSGLLFALAAILLTGCNEEVDRVAVSQSASSSSAADIHGNSVLATLTDGRQVIESGGLIWYPAFIASEVPNQDATSTGNGIEAPAGIVSALLTYDNAASTCSNWSYGGHSNWRLPTRAELIALWATVDDDYRPKNVSSTTMFTEYGWPTFYYYWSVVPKASDSTSYYFVSLRDGWVIGHSPNHVHYVSCVQSL